MSSWRCDNHVFLQICCICLTFCLEDTPDLWSPHPLDLLHLARTTQAFRRVLTNPPFSRGNLHAQPCQAFRTVPRSCRNLSGQISRSTLIVMHLSFPLTSLYPGSFVFVPTFDPSTGYFEFEYALIAPERCTYLSLSLAWQNSHKSCTSLTDCVDDFEDDRRDELLSTIPTCIGSEPSHSTFAPPVCC